MTPMNSELRKELLSISYGVNIPNEATDAVGTKLWLELTELEALIDKQVIEARIDQVRKLESLGDPVLQEKHFDEVIATLKDTLKGGSDATK